MASSQLGRIVKRFKMCKRRGDKVVGQFDFLEKVNQSLNRKGRKEKIGAKTAKKIKLTYYRG